MRPIGRIVSSPTGNTVVFEPRGAEAPAVGMDLKFTVVYERAGTARVAGYDPSTREIRFAQNLNCLVPAVAEGDIVSEYEPPCTRCECRRCTLARVFA